MHEARKLVVLISLSWTMEPVDMRHCDLLMYCQCDGYISSSAAK